MKRKPYQIFIGFVLLLSAMLPLLFGCSEKSIEREPRTETHVAQSPWGRYGDYHVIKFAIKREPSIKPSPYMEIVSIDGRKLSDSVLMEVDFLGEELGTLWHDNDWPAEKLIEVSGFRSADPIGDPIKNFPVDSLERTVLRDVYARKPAVYNSANGRVFDFEDDAILFHVRDVFIVTAVISPPEARQKYEKWLRQPYVEERDRTD